MNSFAKAVVLCAVSCFVAVCSFSQELLKAAPFGKPLMVTDEMGNWSVAISVYSDADREYFIPDVTKSGWIAWHAGQFRATGVFTTTIITWFKTERGCLKMYSPEKRDDLGIEAACKEFKYSLRTVAINARTNETLVHDVIIMTDNALYDPSLQHPVLKKEKFSDTPNPSAYSRIVQIVSSAVANYKGPTSQQVLENNRKVTANMAMQGMTPNNQQGCPNSTKEQLQNWHNTGCPPPAPAPAAH